MKYSKRKKGTTLFSIVNGIALLAMLLSACGGGDAIPVYKVNETTGLYSTFGDIHAEQIAVLAQGTLLVPADGEAKLFCDSFKADGMPFMLCKVEVRETGQTGWVLKLYIEKE